MKKSFCDICGEETSGVRLNSELGEVILISSAIIRDENYPNMHQNRDADLCKKCARELLDKIEL